MCRKVILLLVVSCICLAAGTAEGGTKASAPDPADGTVGVTAPLLRWTKGDTAMFHNVYLGTTPELTEANQVAARQAFEIYYHVPGLEPGVTYYWRVDEIEADGVTIHTGNVWSFTAQALTAYHPSPADGARDATLTPTITWMPGSEAAQHHLYFGDSLDAVSQGSTEADKGVLELADTAFAPGDLENVTTYYWRVDEILTDQTVRTGPVWSFATFLPVEDFESYTDDEGSRIYQTWIDGFTNGASGSTVGHLEAPFAEQTVVHGGLQSMPLDYNNIADPYYSETVRTWAASQDWTVGDVNMLTLYFRGVSTNSPDGLYVALEDKSGTAGTAVYPNPAQVALAAWTRWEIPLTEFAAAGVNLAAVKELYIGVGDRDNPAPGGTGLLYIDDIYLAGPGATLPVTLFAEDFEGLVLGPKVDEAVPGAEVWTETPPPGWAIDESGIPGIGDPTTDGVTEWAGWAFADKDWWIETAEDQNRSQFTRGIGTVAIADPDEWDDAGHADAAAAGWYKTFMSTPSIDIAAAKPGTLKLTFDSSWRPEFDDDYHQTANLTVSFDGGAPEELFRWESDGSSKKYKADATNEAVTIIIDPPAGAATMVLTFGLFDAGNDWWWAIDNITVTAAAK